MNSQPSRKRPHRRGECTMMPRKPDIMGWLMGNRRKVVEDAAKIQAVLRTLNGGATGPWIPTNGFYIWPEFVFGRGGQPNTIKGGEGIVVKVFINSQTGE